MKQAEPHTMQAYNRLTDAGFHPVQAQSLVRALAEVSRSTEMDSYGVAFALRDARKDTWNGEKVTYQMDAGLLANMCEEAVDGGLRSDAWRAEAQKRLAKSLGDDNAAAELLKWVCLVGEVWLKKRASVRNATLRSYAMLVATVLFLVATVIFGVLQELG